jgi:hypothetical protein
MAQWLFTGSKINAVVRVVSAAPAEAALNGPYPECGGQEREV